MGLSCGICLALSDQSHPGFMPCPVCSMPTPGQGAVSVPAHSMCEHDMTTSGRPKCTGEPVGKKTGDQMTIPIAQRAQKGKDKLQRTGIALVLAWCSVGTARYKEGARGFAYGTAHLCSPCAFTKLFSPENKEKGKDSMVLYWHFWQRVGADKCPALREVIHWRPDGGGQPSQKCVAVVPAWSKGSLHTLLQPGSFAQHLLYLTEPLKAKGKAESIPSACQQ